MQHETQLPNLHKQLYELDKSWEGVEKKYRDNRFDNGNLPRRSTIKRRLLGASLFTLFFLAIYLATDSGGIVLTLCSLYLLFRIFAFKPDFSLSKEFEELEAEHFQKRRDLILKIENKPEQSLDEGD